jgi:hypothetical protein
MRAERQRNLASINGTRQRLLLRTGGCCPRLAHVVRPVYRQEVRACRFSVRLSVSCCHVLRWSRLSSLSADTAMHTLAANPSSDVHSASCVDEQSKRDESNSAILQHAIWAISSIGFPLVAPLLWRHQLPGRGHLQPHVNMHSTS